MEKKIVKEFSVTDHGWDTPDYFQGYGICGTDFDDGATGNEGTYRGAFKDALDSLAQNGWDVSSIEKSSEYEEAMNDEEEAPCFEDDDEEESDEPSNLYRYVSILVK